VRYGGVQAAGRRHGQAGVRETALSNRDAVRSGTEEVY